MALWPRPRRSRSSPQFLYLQKRDKLGQFPDVVSEASSHGWRYPKRLVDAGEIVVQKVDSDRVPVVLHFLAKPICQASEPANVHAHGEVLALRMARADFTLIRAAEDCLSPRTDALSWAVRYIHTMNTNNDSCKTRIWADLGGEIKYLNQHGNWTLVEANAKLFSTEEEAKSFAASVGQEGPAQYEEGPFCVNR